MKRTEKHLTLRIAKLKEAIRRKFNSFKTGIVESERFFENKYKPIISELKKTNISSKDELLIGPKKEEEYDDEYNEEVKEEVGKSFEETPLTPVRDTSSALDTLLSTPTGRETVSFYVNEHFENKLTKEYMDLFFRDRGGKAAQIDHGYGPRFDGETLMIGNQKLDFDANGSIIIGGDNTYTGTEGLYQLLFKRVPADYNADDLKVYKEILLKSNAHKKGYAPDGPINRNSSLKYRSVIAQLFPPHPAKKTGSGMQWKTVGSRDIIHWDDPNELVDRLRLLAVSTETGHTSHTNEILNIIEELREGGFIKGSGNQRFQALLR